MSMVSCLYAGKFSVSPYMRSITGFVHCISRRLRPALPDLSRDFFPKSTDRIKFLQNRWILFFRKGPDGRVGWGSPGLMDELSGGLRILHLAALFELKVTSKKGVAYLWRPTLTVLGGWAAQNGGHLTREHGPRPIIFRLIGLIFRRK